MLTEERAERIIGDVDPATRSDVAHMTAGAIVSGGRADSDNAELVKRLITLVDTEGIDIVAGMWADSPATTLPGILWRLYLLREWTKEDGELMSVHFRLGSQNAQVDEVIAGLAHLPGPEEVRAGVDAVLRSEEHTSELQSRGHLVCRLLLEKKKIELSIPGTCVVEKA